MKKNTSGLPDHLKSGIENLSGHSMDDVTVHYNSDVPAQLKSHLYDRGMAIHIGHNEGKQLPHEALHVIQQEDGRIRPTLTAKAGVTINDDQKLENEADMLGTEALQMRSDPGKSS